MGDLGESTGSEGTVQIQFAFKVLLSPANHIPLRISEYLQIDKNVSKFKIRIREVVSSETLHLFSIQTYNFKFKSIII